MMLEFQTKYQYPGKSLIPYTFFDTISKILRSNGEQVIWKNNLLIFLNKLSQL